MIHDSVACIYAVSFFPVHDNAAASGPCLSLYKPFEQMANGVAVKQVSGPGLLVDCCFIVLDKDLRWWLYD
jgi:hypothetical protein